MRTVIFLLRVAWGACVVLVRRVVRGPLRPSWSLRTEVPADVASRGPGPVCTGA